MKKSIVFTAVFLSTLSTLNTFSQSKEYEKIDISTYFSPDILRQQLDLTFDLSNSFNTSKNNLTESSQNNFNWDFKPFYNRYTNNRKVVSNLSFDGSSNGTLSNTSTPYNANHHNIVNSINANYALLLYSKTKFHFIINTLAAYKNTLDARKTDENQNTDGYDNKTSNLNLNAGLGIGFGRIENVEDARQAIYILSTLTDKNRMLRTLNKSEVFEFAQAITAVKNKRHLDYRLRKIEEISAVDSFLVHKNIKSASDATYFSTLNDMWEYGALASRKSGLLIQLIAKPCYFYSIDEYNKEFYNSKDRTERNAFEGTAELNLQYERPSNLYWQHSIGLNIKYTYNDELNHLISGTKYKDWSNMVYGFGYYSLGFYPNTRTFYTGSILVNSGLNRYNVEHSVSDYILRSSRASLMLQMNYFVSPQLKLSANASINYNYYNYWDNIDKTFAAGAAVRLSYSFF